MIALLMGLSVAVGVLLVEVALAMIAPGSHRGIRIVLGLAGGAVAAAVTALGVQWFLVLPLDRLLRVIHRLTQGDFAARTGARGTGPITNVMTALDHMAGLCEMRWEAARASENRYRKLYENSPAGLYRTRADGRVLECNMAFVRILGYDSAVDVKTRNAQTFYARPEEREALLGRLAQEDVVAGLRLDLCRKDGRVIPVLLTVGRTTVDGEACLEGQLIEVSEAGPVVEAAPEGEAAPAPEPLTGFGTAPFRVPRVPRTRGTTGPLR